MNTVLFLKVLNSTLCILEPNDLKADRTIHLEKDSGEIDQIVIGPAGILVRDDQPFEKELQEVALYASDGKRLREFGSAGREPGQFVNPRAAALVSNEVWVLDLLGRVSKFDITSGEFLSSRLLQKPGYRPRDFAVARNGEEVLITGCVPLKYYLTDGCTLVHKYDSDLAFRESSFETPALAVDSSWFPIEDYLVTVVADGRVAVVDSPIMQVFILDPGLTKERSFPVGGENVEQFQGAVDPSGSWQDLEDERQAMFYIDQLESAGNAIGVSIRSPPGDAHIFEAWTPEGELLIRSTSPPGRLVGVDRGSFVFASPASESRGWELHFVRVDQ